ncbi:hypothetical protein A3K82_01200 [Candidatus Pacearchaeota archaeon RBG_19FT_COMBO_34_9]|nr:MAG: hypothetical protein A3K82_01200 [Candidatus Pacearchaeota archaeon RBG_19FT_COMBO_34_9]OGJ16332.1 MAG: hypothetical protein A3K74_01930 [Candidatus Pacearchaeota archaeon RBG_13_33_26]
MDNNPTKKLDNLARRLQSRVFDYRIQARGPNDLDGRMYENAWAISQINEVFKTRYLTYELCRISMANLDTSRLPLIEGDEKIFENKK